MEDSFGNTRYTYEVKRKNKWTEFCYITILRGDIELPKWEELPSLIEKVNEDNDVELLEFENINDNICSIKFTMEDGTDTEDMKGWMDELAYKMFGEDINVEIC